MAGYDPTDELLPPYNRLNEPTFGELARARAGGGFAHLGNVIGSTLAGGGARDIRGAQVFQQAATGSARLQDILLQARQRRDAEIGRQAAAADAVKNGDAALGSLYLQGKVTPQGLGSYQLDTQKHQNIGDLMTEARGAAPDMNRLNRELMVMHGQPVNLTKVEGQNVLDPYVTPDVQTVAPTDIGTAMIGTQQASAAQHYASAGAANAERDLRAGPMTDAAYAEAALRRSKIGPDGAPVLKASRLTVPEMTTALGGDPNDHGVRHIDPKRLQQFNTLQQGMIEAGDPNAKNAQYVLQKFEQSYGNDPADVPEGTFEAPPELQTGLDYAAKHGGHVPLGEATTQAGSALPAPATAAGSPPAVGAPVRKIVRTGTDQKTGKRVVQYDDGSIEAAP